jgi:hypothetical protein
MCGGMRPSPRMILLLFVVAQISDGLLTYGAVRLFGVDAEGNLLLATWMHVAGAGPTLIAAKLIAAACGLLLYWRGFHLLLVALTALYMLGAIGPWLVIFSSF